MDKKKGTYSSLEDVPDSAWRKLSRKTFYFGHQSVGYNIIDGVQDIMEEYPKIKINIVESTDVEYIIPGTIAHSRVGKNREPNAKIDDFVNYIEGGIGKKANAAALKLCYVDFTDNTDPVNLFNEYKKKIEGVQKSYPELTIIHFTSPLTALQTGPKAWIKKIIGRPVFGVRENIKRHEYNELIKKQYKGKAPLIDIAQIESTYPDGTRAKFKVDGKRYYKMVPEYTNDGGHLNAIGRKKVAEEFLLALLRS